MGKDTQAPKRTPDRSPHSGPVVAALIALSIAAGMAGGWAMNALRQAEGASVKVVVFDPVQIMDSAFATVQDSGVSPQESQIVAQGYAIDMVEALQAYTDAGYIVLNKDLVVAQPLSEDITPEIANQLGLDLSRTIQPSRGLGQ